MHIIVLLAVIVVIVSVASLFGLLAYYNFYKPDEGVNFESHNYNRKVATQNGWRYK